MQHKWILGTLVGGVVRLLLAGSAFLTGVGPAPGGADDEVRITDFPTGTAYDPGAETATTGTTSASGGSVDSTHSGATPPFSFTVDSIEECGQTCRDVTVSLRNEQNDTATGVTVFTRIYAGRNNTNDDDVVWETKAPVGELEGGAAYTSTKRVDLSLREGLEIERENGWITIVTTVTSDRTSITFTDAKQVT